LGRIICGIVLQRKGKIFFMESIRGNIYRGNLIKVVGEGRLARCVGNMRMGALKKKKGGDYMRAQHHYSFFFFYKYNFRVQFKFDVWSRNGV
jgi:hypothetical protein